MTKKDRCTIPLFICVIGLVIVVIGFSAQRKGIILKEKYPIKLMLTFEEAIPDPKQPVLLVFFSTVCPTCWNELFEAKYLIESNGFPVQLVGVSVEKPEYLKPFLEKYSFPYPVISDRHREVYRRFNVQHDTYKILLQGNKVLYREDVLQDTKTQRKMLEQCIFKVLLPPFWISFLRGGPDKEGPAEGPQHSQLCYELK